MARIVNVKVEYLRKGLSSYNKEKYDNLEEWTKNDKHLYIGRKGVVFIKNKEGNKERFPKKDSIWANPFVIGKDGNRNDVLIKYVDYILDKVINKELLLDELKGKVLGCWCHPEKCHGDVLICLLQYEKLIDKLINK